MYRQNRFYIFKSANKTLTIVKEWTSDQRRFACHTGVINDASRVTLIMINDASRVTLTRHSSIGTIGKLDSVPDNGLGN